MGPFLPLHNPGSWACSMVYAHVKLRNGKQCHSTAYCTCVVLCCINATKPDMFCHSVLLSVMFYLVWVTRMSSSSPVVLSHICFTQLYCSSGSQE
jgi:hypothetical protein